MNWKIEQGDVLPVLKTLPKESVQCVVTSPPYWSLRDYKVDGQIGLEPTPEAYVEKMVEVFREVKRVLRRDGTLWLNLGSSYAGSGKDPTGWNGIGDQSKRQGFVGNEHVPAYGSDGKAPQGSSVIGRVYSDFCDECRAVSLTDDIGDIDQQTAQSVRPSERKDRDTLRQGFSPKVVDALPHDAQVSTTPESLPQPQAECFHCANCGVCLNVLRSSVRDGKLCVRRKDDIGDTSLLNETSAYHMTDRVLSSTAWRYLTTDCLKSKDMVCIPWLVALALQMDGWWLRSDIIWSKPNSMPESVTDRPTKSHEYLFLLTKSSQYYYDQEAVREEWTCNRDDMRTKGIRTGLAYLQQTAIADNSVKHMKAFDDSQAGGGTSFRGHSGYAKADGSPIGTPVKRNLRTVWIIPTQPFPQAHFSTYPEKLVEPCIRAGTSEKGCCTGCGAPWKRVVQKTFVQEGVTRHRGKEKSGDEDAKSITMGDGGKIGHNMVETMRWEACCACQTDTQPCLVLDPFCGSGTTGVVALKLQRSFLGIELNPAYVEMAKRRLGEVMPLFVQEVNHVTE